MAVVSIPINYFFWTFEKVKFILRCESTNEQQQTKQNFDVKSDGLIVCTNLSRREKLVFLIFFLHIILSDLDRPPGWDFCSVFFPPALPPLRGPHSLPLSPPNRFFGIEYFFFFFW